tara:strand:- start:2462 stop:2647 length:186 start_codon:yes stop_codon:yes gene_type:complete
MEVVITPDETTIDMSILSDTELTHLMDLMMEDTREYSYADETMNRKIYSKLHRMKESRQSN